MRRILLPAFALFTVACSGTTAAPPLTPGTTPAPAPAAIVQHPTGPEAFILDGAAREEWLPLLKAPVVDPAKSKLVAAPAGLAPLPAECDVFTSHKGGGATPSCADAKGAIDALDAAMGEADPGKRDAHLLDLEACAGLPAGAMRALRAELAPAACGEAIVTPTLAAPPAGISGNVYEAMRGLAIASRLSRTAQGVPTLAAPFTRPRVKEFNNGSLMPWFVGQATVIKEVSQNAAELPYYAKGIAAVESGIADMRLVESVRNAPLPDEIGKDPELKNQYYGSLDQVLDPLKDAGREAALAGLRELSLVGAIHDARVDQARALLSRLYGGRRIDALDALLLAQLAPLAPTNAEERLAARLPTFYAGLILDPAAASRAGTMRALLERGVPLQHRIALKTATLSPETRALWARGRLELGRLYWRSVDFDQSAALAAGLAPDARPEEATLTLAVAIALRNGPDDAADMMHKAPLQLTSIGKVAALDFVSQAKPAGKYAGLAAFDAAVIHQLASPQGADAAYWKDVAGRYRQAAALLTDPAKRADAAERARSADDLAAAIK